MKSPAPGSAASSLEQEHNKTMPALTWDRTEEVAIVLHKNHPEIDPLKIRFIELHRRVTELPDFQDDPAAATGAKLEAIQAAWYEEWKEGQEKRETERT